MGNIPNFLFIGPDKSGSTWVDGLLRSHPAVYMSPAKELFFFDRYYHKGWDWYLKHFRGAAPHHRVIADISHDYLYSTEACERIAEHLPGVRLMVCLREPCDRAFSAYLYMRRQGRISGSFEDALEHMSELVDHGRYATHLDPFVKAFGRDRIHIAVFDDLKFAPQTFADDLFEFLDVERLALTKSLTKPALPAAAPRWQFAAKIAKRAALVLRDLGLPGLVSRIKQMGWMQRGLYRAYDINERPCMNPKVHRQLRDLFKPEIIQLDARYRLNLRKRWGY
jgi:hypothetical protein